jgi:hypothetical protein
MPCNCCSIARDFPTYKSFNPACIFCGARILMSIGMRRIGVTECRMRRTAMLKVWVDWGHSEMEIRQLFKNAVGLESLVESAPLKNKKRR